MAEARVAAAQLVQKNAMERYRDALSKQMIKIHVAGAMLEEQERQSVEIASKKAKSNWRATKGVDVKLHRERKETEARQKILMEETKKRMKEKKKINAEKEVGWIKRLY